MDVASDTPRPREAAETLGGEGELYTERRSFWALLEEPSTQRQAILGTIGAISFFLVPHPAGRSSRQKNPISMFKR